MRELFYIISSIFIFQHAFAQQTNINKLLYGVAYYDKNV